MMSKRNPDKPAIDLENVCVRLIMIGQRRQLELGPLFDYELSAVPASLIDEQGCLRKGNKSALVKRLGVIECTPATADIVIVDVQQLLYRIVWPKRDAIMKSKNNKRKMASVLSTVHCRRHDDN